MGYIGDSRGRPKRTRRRIASKCDSLVARASLANVDDQITLVLFDLLRFHHGGHKLAKLASLLADEYAAADVSPVAIDRWWEW